jgi:hypothetical protein
MEEPTLRFDNHPDHEETDGFIDRLIAQTERSHRGAAPGPLTAQAAQSTEG